ncbi:MAG: HAMP domain-containing protein [Gammaproteobacteria bacterium]|nr:HAMP domain-containing protein [Gammaproteobacteria bacterium]
MPRSLYSRLALSLAVSLLIVGVLYAFLVVSSARQYQQQVDQRLNLDLAAKLVEERGLVVSGHIDQAALKATFDAYMTINPNIEIYLLDAAGTILSYSADPGKVKRKRVSVVPIRAFLAGQRLPVLGDDPRSFEQRKVFSATPVPDARHVDGYLYVVLRGERYDDIAQYLYQSLVWRQSTWALGGSLLFGLGAGLVLFYLLTRRLNRLSAAMDTLRDRNFEAYTPLPLPRGRGDEIDHLTVAFDDMARRIVAQLDELRHQDLLRRDLVANVSHDLRTPMAILNGYLETLAIKGPRLDEREFADCLRSALKSSERLTRLIDDLFELARLEALTETPAAESFNVTELAQDIIQKFSLKARDKGLDLTLEAGDRSCFVTADIGQISRVLENLIANALAATEKGAVTISVDKDGDGVLIGVADTGPGIPEAELTHIFERFYRGVHGHNAPGGLGLAISHRIVALHGGRLEVESRTGLGSRFFFRIPNPGS